jgi:hypothetical protein
MVEDVVECIVTTVDEGITFLVHASRILLFVAYQSAYTPLPLRKD